MSAGGGQYGEHRAAEQGQSWLSMASSLVASSIESVALDMIKPFIDAYVDVNSLQGDTIQFDGSALVLQEVVSVQSNPMPLNPLAPSCTVSWLVFPSLLAGSSCR